MNLFQGGFVVILSCFVGVAIAGPLNGQEASRAQVEAAHPQWIQLNQELQDLIHRTQVIAEQSQAELRRSREQNEKLEQLLEKTRLELTELRQELSRLRSGTDLRQSSAGTAAPVEKKPLGDDPGPGRASTPTAPGANLAARLDEIEDQVEINTAQIKEQAQTKVESGSRFKVRLFGTVLNNTYYNTSDNSEQAVPTVAQPNSARPDNSGHNFGSTLRQSRFGFAMTGPKLGGARLSADADFDFFGGADGHYEGNPLGALRMRTASARLDGSRTSLAMGLMAPMISPLNPTSLAAVYYPALAESGNLWQWRPQITLERRTPVGEADALVLQGGLMMPFGDTINGRVLEGRPGYESRFAFTRSLDAERRLEIGVGGYFHPQRFGFGRTVDSYAWTSDWLIPLYNRLELSGEVFYGQSISLSEQSGGDIGSMFAFTGPLDDPPTRVRGIHSAGGWAQLSASATPRLEFNIAFGVDDPRNRDVFAGLFENTARLKNQTFSINSIYRLRSNLLISLEYRHLWTTYPEGRATSDHINLAVGYAF